MTQLAMATSASEYEAQQVNLPELVDTAQLLRRSFLERASSPAEALSFKYWSSYRCEICKRVLFEPLFVRDE